MNKSKYILNSISVLSGEMIENQGEDSYSYKVSCTQGYAGVFDGCGGTGARRYEAFGSHTGAYIASRAAALSANEWWKQYHTSTLSADDLTGNIQKKLAVLKEKSSDSAGGIALKGSLISKSFPTTASLIAFDFQDDPLSTFIWAGDSRGYILDCYGLSQVTRDDIDGAADAYQNIESDARVSNVINADKPFVLHEKGIRMELPAVLITATDGCFSYYQTPMEFEYLLLSTLVNAKSIYDWEKKLSQYLSRQASDDYTLIALVCGFHKFKDIRAYFKDRLRELHNGCIGKIQQARKSGTDADIEALWEQYKGMYYRYEY